MGNLAHPKLGIFLPILVLTACRLIVVEERSRKLELKSDGMNGSDEFPGINRTGDVGDRFLGSV